MHAEPQIGAFAILSGLFSYQFGAAVAGLLGLLLVMGVLIWLLERRQPHFDARPSHGIADGVWWAAVTMTSTGYGDKVPVTLGGRLLGVVWMFASIFLVALFSATLASSFVLGDSRPISAAPATWLGREWPRLRGQPARNG